MRFSMHWRQKGDPPEDEPVEAVEETVLAVGNSDTATIKHKTLKLCGTIGKLDVLILVDSGIVGTFTSSQLAERLQVPLSECPPTHYIAADGSPMICSHQVKNCNGMFRVIPSFPLWGCFH